MARILGFNITRPAPRIKAEATEFEVRSIRNSITAASLPSEKSTVEIAKAGMGVTRPDGQRFGNLPPVRVMENEADQNNLSERFLGSDPRESYWAILPNKIQPKQAEQMIRATLAGDLWQGWRLNAAMKKTWPKYRMAAHQLREAVSYCKFAIHAYSENGKTPTDSAIEKRDLITRAISSMSPNPFSDEKRFSGMIYNFTEGIELGLTMEELIWKDPEQIPGGAWQRIPKASAWTHPRHFTFDQRGQIVMFGNPQSLATGDRRFYGKSIGEVPNPNKMICSQFMTQSGSSIASGLMIVLVWWWAARQYGLDFVLRNAQNFGAPFVDVTYKPTMNATEKAQMLAEIIKGLGNRVLMHVEGSTLEVTPPANLGSDNPQRWLIEESDRECLYVLLGQTGSTISEAGKLGNDDSKNEVKQERVKGVAEWVAQNSLDQFIRAIMRVNYGNEDECPSASPDFTKPLSSIEVGALFTAISNSKVPVKAEELYGKTGFTKPEAGETVFQGGEIKILGEALTDEQKFEQQLEMQEQQNELNQPLEENQPAKAFEPFSRGTNVRLLLAKASDTDISELESIVKSVETAPHQNGELKLLTKKLGSLKNKRR